MLSSFHRQVVNLALREDFLAFDHSISKSPTKCIKILQMLMTDTLVCLCHSCTQHFQTLSAQLDSLVRISQSQHYNQTLANISVSMIKYLKLFPG